MNLELSLYSERKLDLTKLLDEAMFVEGLTSLNRERRAVLAMFSIQPMWILNDGTNVYGCCGIRHHLHYNYIGLFNTPTRLNDVYELCALYISPVARKQGWLRKMTELRIDYLKEENIVIELRPGSKWPELPSVHPDALPVEALAVENGFMPIGLIPTDNSPVYYRTANGR